jgi:hypothetical protein
MNQRIQELMKDADAWHFHDNRGQFVMEEFCEKFAELLVQDCANWIRNNYDHESAEPLAFYMEMYYGLHGDYA